MVLHRHPESWIPEGELGTVFPPYRPTFGERPFVNEAHAALAETPMDGWLIDVGITGWLRRDDALKLYELAYLAESDVLEIGCAHGLSTSIIAGALRDAGRPATLVSVDLHEGRMGDAKRTVAERGLAERVEFVLGDAAAVCESLVAAGRRFGFAFVDHSHAYEPVLAVLRTLPALLTEGGFCLIHDFNDARNDDPANRRYGVRQAVKDGLPADSFAFYGVYGCTALYRQEGVRGRDGLAPRSRAGEQEG